MPDALRMLGLIVAGLVLVVLAAAAGIYFISDSRLNRSIPVQVETIAVPTDIATVQHGQHLASAVAVCVECHGPNLGGKVVVDDPSIGRIMAPNLTRGRGGAAATFSNADFVRAIRYGSNPSGRVLLLMPSDDYNHFSDADLGAIIAYIKSIAPIDNSLPSSEIRPIGRILFTVGQLPLQPAASIDRAAPRSVPSEPSVSVEYGAYLALVAGCPSCHGPELNGGRIPGAPAGTPSAANITPFSLGAWSDADFTRAMRTGVRPGGGHINTYMPWPYYAQMTEDELRAVWRFLQSVPARPNSSG